jgi:hypothetical protein
MLHDAWLSGTDCCVSVVRAVQGVKTINLVRSAKHVDDLKELGAGGAQGAGRQGLRKVRGSQPCMSHCFRQALRSPPLLGSLIDLYQYQTV